MGSEQSNHCCLTPKNAQVQFKAIAQKEINKQNNYKAEKQLQTYKYQLNQVNLLSSLNYQIAFIENYPPHRQSIIQHFQNINQFIDLIDTEESKSLVSVLNSKTVHPKHERYNLVDNSIIFLQICLYQQFFQSNSDSSLQASKLHKEKLQHQLNILKTIRINPFESYPPQEYIKILIEGLKAIPGVQNYIWDIRQRKSYSSMAEHLYYNLNKYIHFINSQLSYNDPLSLTNIKYFYHFAQRFLCINTFNNLQSLYICQLQADQVEVELYQTTNILFSPTFLNFRPKQILGNNHFFNRDQRQSASTNLIENNQAQIHLILIPLSQSLNSIKFKHYQKLYYLPFSTFYVKQVVRQENIINIYISELENQILINTISKPLQEVQQYSMNHVGINQQNLLNQLKSMRDNLQKKLEKTYKMKSQFSEPKTPLQSQSTFVSKYKHQDKAYKYYQNYKNQKIIFNFKNKQPIKITQKPISIIDHKQLPEQKIKNEVLPEVQQESTPQMVEFGPSQLKKYERKIEDYMDNMKLEKLQNQIALVDRFFYLTTLNLSFCSIQRIECLECFPNLIELYLYSNEITKIQGLQRNKHLKTLSLSRNQIANLDNIHHLDHLRNLFVTKNRLQKSSAQYLTSQSFKLLRTISISFINQSDESFEILIEKAKFKLKSLVINDAKYLTTRTLNKLNKKFKNTKIELVIY